MSLLIKVWLYSWFWYDIWLLGWGGGLLHVLEPPLFGDFNFISRVLIGTFYFTWTKCTWRRYVYFVFQKKKEFYKVTCIVVLISLFPFLSLSESHYSVMETSRATLWERHLKCVFTVLYLTLCENSVLT